MVTIFIANTFYDTILLRLLSFQKIESINWGSIIPMILSIIIAASVAIATWLIWRQTVKALNHDIQDRKLLSTPHLNFCIHLDRTQSPIGIEIRNQGVGPAIIKNIEIKVHNIQVDTKHQSYMQRVVNAMESSGKYTFSVFSPRIGTYMPVGSSEWMIKYDFEVLSNDVYQTFKDLLSQMEIKITYESVYEEEKVAELDKLTN